MPFCSILSLLYTFWKGVLSLFFYDKLRFSPALSHIFRNTFVTYSAFRLPISFNGWICCYYRWTIQGANKSRNEEVGETDLRPICPSLWACEIGGIHKVIQIEKFVSKSKLIYIRLGINFRFTKTGKYQHWNSNFHL